MNFFTFLFLLCLTASYAVQFWLANRQKNHVLSHRDAVPDAFKNTISLAEHQKAADYTVEKGRLGNIDGTIDVLMLLLFTLGGGINAIFDYWTGFNWSPLITGIIAMMSISFIGLMIDLPMSYYQTFVIEEKYGFNKTTPAQFFKDQAMFLALGAVIGLPLLALILWLMDSIGDSWWLWAWAILISFSLLMGWLYPTVIAPLFNKFTPMEEGALKQCVQGLLERCGFQSEGIFIMDGSKRSGHGNAYFTGFGKHKRIVFFDTLVKSLTNEELEAVLAHELGHYKCKHVFKMLFASAIMQLFAFAILGWLIDKTWFYNGLGVEHISNAAALLLFMWVAPIFTLFLQPISAYFQRQFEFEADSFAAEYAQASKLISGLVKLYQENASTLTPDPLYSAFHYSHPPAAIRIAHLENKSVA